MLDNYGYALLGGFFVMIVWSLREDDKVSAAIAFCSALVVAIGLAS